jgi:pseudouridine-5'-phosphate glycosidase
MRAASMAGIRFLATGGIGGVHRGHAEDQSADLIELVLSEVAVFCAGPKIILDLLLTMERLETLGVPVLGFGVDEVPGFYTRTTGRRVSARVDGPDQAAHAIGAAWDTGARGVLVCVPPPAELANAEMFVEQATSELAHLSGADVTPRLLARIAELSGGRSIEVNVDLVVNNSRVAAQVARTFMQVT